MSSAQACDGKLTALGLAGGGVAGKGCGVGGGRLLQRCRGGSDAEGVLPLPGPSELRRAAGRQAEEKPRPSVRGRDGCG